MPENAWVSLIIRDGHLVPAHAHTALRPGDEVVILGEAADAHFIRNVFTGGRPRR